MMPMPSHFDPPGRTIEILSLVLYWLSLEYEERCGEREKERKRKKKWFSKATLGIMIINLSDWNRIKEEDNNWLPVPDDVNESEEKRWKNVKIFMWQKKIFFSFEICTHHFQTSSTLKNVTLCVWLFLWKMFLQHTHKYSEVENNWLLLLWFSIAIHIHKGRWGWEGRERDFYEWMMQIPNLIIMNSPWIVLLFTVACRVFKKPYFIAINFLLILSAFVCHFAHSLTHSLFLPGKKLISFHIKRDCYAPANSLEFRLYSSLLQLI
jgi:hypothetical protein